MQPKSPLTWTLLACLALPLALSSCGYSLVGRASNVPDDVKAVYVQPLENRTARTQVDQFLTRAIADELVTRRRFEVLSSAGGADAVISGAVTGFAVTPVSFDAEGRATEYEVVIRAAMQFRRVPDRPDEEGQLLWSNSAYQFRENYPVELTDLAYFDQEDLALQEAAKRFSETVVSDLLEGF
jgi:hypothetical protein